MKVLILCNGEPPGQELLKHYVAQADFIVCTDGALGWALAAGVQPDVVVGDMDSLVDTPPCETLDFGPHELQENSDAEKALRVALQRGARQIVLLGATGRRLDHTLANIWIAVRYQPQADIQLVDDYGELHIVLQAKQLRTHLGQRVSLLALTPDVIVATEGLRWPLHGALEMGTRGLSNEAEAQEIAVQVRRGIVAVILLREQDPA